MDKELEIALEKEHERQQNNIELIASENYASKYVRELQGSILTNKYAEGYPGHRYYGGCQYIDIFEELARKYACELFNASYECFLILSAEAKPLFLFSAFSINVSIH